MSIRKSLGILVFCTQAVVAVDYNMQSRAAGLSPGALSMKDYAAIVQRRYEQPLASNLAAADVAPRLATEVARGKTKNRPSAAASDQSPAAAAVCIRRGTALDCQ